MRNLSNVKDLCDSITMIINNTATYKYRNSCDVSLELESIQSQFSSILFLAFIVHTHNFTFYIKCMVVGLSSLISL